MDPTGRVTGIKKEKDDDGDDDDNDDDIMPALALSGGAPNVAQSPEQIHDHDHSHNEDDDEIDHVVQEIPVYLSPELSQRLYLIQYPLQISSKASSSTTAAASQNRQQQHHQHQAPETARIKPRHCRLEVEFPVPLDGTMDTQGLYAMQKRKFESHTVPVSTHLALGKLLPVSTATASAMPQQYASTAGIGSSSSGGTTSSPFALHLVPLSQITQLRPSFGHVDQEHAIEKAMDSVEIEGSDEDVVRKPVSISKKESERAVLARRSSYAFRQSSIDLEPWQNLQVHNAQSDRAAEIIRTNVACPNIQQSISLTMTSSLTTAAEPSTNNLGVADGTARYVSSLNYMPKQTPSIPANAIGAPVASTDASLDDDDVPIDDPAAIVRRLVHLLHQGWPTPYSVLRSHFPDEITDDGLFVALGSCAVLVQGNFCLSSKLIPFSSTKLVYARSFILYLFQTLRVIHRERLEHAFSVSTTNGSVQTTSSTNGKSSIDMMVSGITPESVQMLLEQVGRRARNSQGSGEGWVLKVEEDTTFSERYPEAMVVHNQYWAQQSYHFEPLLKRYREEI